MNILLIYGDELGTFGRYWKNSLSKKHSVITCGPKKPDGKSQDIATNKNVVDILKIIEKIPKSKKPDLILQLDSPFHLYLQNLEKVVAKTAFFWTDVTIKLPILRHYASCFNHLFTVCETFVHILSKAGLNAYYLPFAISPEVHRDYNLERTIDVGFVGNLSTIYNPKRAYYLKYLSSQVPIQVKTKIFENDMAKFYSQCKIIFNLSATPGINMRTFEALATGALLVQNASCTEANDYFINGRDFVVYKSVQHAVKFIKYYLAHPKERVRIARQGQKKVMKHHLYQNRADQLIDIIKNKPPQRKSKDEIEKALGKSIFMSNLDFPKNTTKPLIAKVIPKSLHQFFIFTIRQIETLQFKWTIPLWYLALPFATLKARLDRLNEHS